MEMQKILIYLLWKRMQFRKKRKPRSLWVLPIFEKDRRRACGDGENLISEIKFIPYKYKNYFRMNLETFEFLLALVEPKIARVVAKREPISPRTRLSITIRYLATGDSRVSLSYAYRVGVSTVSEIISETLLVIWEVLKPLVLCPPTKEKWLAISEGFKNRWNFPNCIGAIDGKHIKIQAPPNCGSTYYNYKGYHSIVLLAICDSKYNFSLIDVGATGRQSDGGIFAYSQIGKLLESKDLNIPPSGKISELRIEVPHVIVGDEAFPLLSNLLKPYPRSSTVDVDELVFNYRLSRARLVVENSFGILASRWRIFSRTISAKVENMENIVKAAVCLHNLVLKRDGNNYLTAGLVDKEDQNGRMTPGSWRKETSTFTPFGRIGCDTDRKNSKLIRETFKGYFNEEGAITWQWKHI